MMTIEDLAEMIDEAAWTVRNLSGSVYPAPIKGWWPDGMPLRVLG